MSKYGRLWEDAREIREKLEKLAPGCTKSPIQLRIDALINLKNDLIEVEKKMALCSDDE